MQTEAGESISVAELARRLRRAVEGVTGREWVEGEVASLRAAASGHLYFALKDEREDALVDCVLYRAQALRARRLVVDGARIQLLGRATVWAPRGRLQLVGESVRPAGRGALLVALEALRARLAAEGLFAAERKRPLPAEPRIVGVVTSAHGAAFRDVVTVALRRARVRIVLAPARVQGEGAPESIVQALERLERLPGLDVIIVGRGGGSGDDLMAFNDERVVRRVAATRVPVISAVGHEIDTTLTDAAADLRAATPSQAAELAVPDEAARRAALERVEASLRRAIRGRIAEDLHALAATRGRLRDPRFLLLERQQELDELTERLERRTRRAITAPRARAEELARRLAARHPRAVLAAARAELLPLEARLSAAARGGVAGAGAELARLASALDALSPLAVLGRGYAIALRTDGVALRRAGDVAPGAELRIRLADGEIDARVTAARGGAP